MEKQSARSLILKMLQEKAIMKQDVYQNTRRVFKEFKAVVKEVGADMEQEIKKIDDRIEVVFSETGNFQADLRFAGDVLIFHMHSNVFNFDASHSIFKLSYVQEEPRRAYCGVITIYNFLADSFKYNRVNDAGYLVARLFVNKENHYFVEGKRQLGFLYNDFGNSVINKEGMRSIIESAMLYTLDFDLLTPPYDEVKEVSVNEFQEATKNMLIKTGKRMGFSFRADSDNIE